MDFSLLQEAIEADQKSHWIGAAENGGTACFYLRCFYILHAIANLLSYHALLHLWISTSDFAARKEYREEVSPTGPAILTISRWPPPRPGNILSQVVLCCLYAFTRRSGSEISPQWVNPLPWVATSSR